MAACWHGAVLLLLPLLPLPLLLLPLQLPPLRLPLPLLLAGRRAGR